jgi:hypothetical protein
VPNRCVEEGRKRKEKDLWDDDEDKTDIHLSALPGLFS